MSNDRPGLAKEEEGDLQIVQFYIVRASNFLAAELTNLKTNHGSTLPTSAGQKLGEIETLGRGLIHGINVMKTFYPWFEEYQRHR